MQYAQLGNTGTFVSRLCLGTMTFGGKGTLFGIMGGLDQKESDALVGQSLDAGINFVDTANVYAGGESETILGKALGVKRKDVVLATKAFGRMGSGPNQVGVSRLALMQQVEASLKRLGTDYIDLYQIHGWDPVTPIDEALRTFDDLVRQGKVRYVGVSNWSAWQIMKALGISERQGLEKFATLQAYYSLVGRDLEHEIVPFLEDQKLGLLTWSPLAGGVLSGKFSRDSRANEGRRTQFDFPPVDVEHAYDVIDVLKGIANKYGVTVAQVALGWQLHKSYVTSVIIGAKNETQLKDNLGAVDVKLSAEDLAAIDKVSAPKPLYPNWMRGMQSDRAPGAVRDWSTVAKSTF
ncbi:MAG: aldo/keto reductase [Parvibaculum sp.]|uniref:aldo/keto reductase n=1 Tax=Parvibaculum sp. TaxID=2024848 RepID=UPI00284EA2B9|nr:aldo/keto reductase [Parvibaculum sp.]MDR3500371.1 aldo/keto reductase [Parvibaculum sp.]